MKQVWKKSTAFMLCTVLLFASFAANADTLFADREEVDCAGAAAKAGLQMAGQIGFAQHAVSQNHVKVPAEDEVKETNGSVSKDEALSGTALSLVQNGAEGAGEKTPLKEGADAATKEQSPEAAGAEAVKKPTEPNEKPVADKDTDVDKSLGRWSIPAVGVNVACYAGEHQYLVDRKDSAAMFAYGSQTVIADHDYQGFAAIKKCEVGTVAYWSTGSEKQKYVCVERTKGHNTGEKLTDENYVSVRDMNSGGITCYTCDGSNKNVVIVFFQPVREDGVAVRPFVVTKDNRDLVGYTGREGEELEIPASFRGKDGIMREVVAIDARAFQNCTNLKRVVLPDSVAEIGYQAFYGCANLEEVVLPKKLESLDDSVFSESGLVSVVVPEGVKDVKTAFSRCRKLVSLTLPEGLFHVKQSAFAGCNSLEWIRLPASMRSIGPSATSGCAKLTTIYFSGAEAQWNDVSVNAKYNNALLNATVHCEG